MGNLLLLFLTVHTAILLVSLSVGLYALVFVLSRILKGKW